MKKEDLELLLPGDLKPGRYYIIYGSNWHKVKNRLIKKHPKAWLDLVRTCSTKFLEFDIKKHKKNSLRF